MVVLFFLRATPALYSVVGPPAHVCVFIFLGMRLVSSFSLFVYWFFLLIIKPLNEMLKMAGSRC